MQAKPQDGYFKCPHCPRRFAKFQSLGGHKSKAHAGQSVEYAKKMRIRDARTDKRMLLQEAKEILKERHDGITKDSINYLTLLNKIKAELQQKADTAPQTDQQNSI